MSSPFPSLLSRFPSVKPGPRAPGSNPLHPRGPACPLLPVHRTTSTSRQHVPHRRFRPFPVPCLTPVRGASLRCPALVPESRSAHRRPKAEPSGSGPALKGHITWRPLAGLCYGWGCGLCLQQQTTSNQDVEGSGMRVSSSLHIHLAGGGGGPQKPPSEVVAARQTGFSLVDSEKTISQAVMRMSWRMHPFLGPAWAPWTTGN